MLRIALLSLLLCIGVIKAAQAESDLKVIIGDVMDYPGTLRMFVHNEQSYPLEENALMYLKLKAETGDMVHHITGLKKGRYAIVVHHDEDNDDDFQTNQFGMGEEGVGYTEDPRLDFGAPEFQDIWFDYDGKEGVAIVYMVY